MKAGYLIIIFAAFTAACTPRFYPPRVSVPDDYIYGRGFSEDTTRFGPEWWTLFGDTVLNNLVARALDNNRDVAVAASRVEEARLNLKSVRAQYLPQVGLGVTAEGEYTPATKIVQSYAVEPSLSWEVALFGQLRNAKRAAKAQIASSEWALRGVRLALAAEVATTYFTLLEYERDLAIARQSCALRRESAALIDSMFRYGMSDGVALEQARSLVYTAEADIPQYRRAVAQTRLSLDILLGETPRRTDSAGAGLRLLTDYRPADIPVGLPSELLERRPDIMQARYDMLAAAAEVGIARGNRFPSIALTTKGGIASNSIKGLTSANPWAWDALGSLTLPVFNFGRLRRAEQAAMERYTQSALTYEQTVLTAFSDVPQADRTLRRAGSRQRPHRRDDAGALPQRPVRLPRRDRRPAQSLSVADGVRQSGGAAIYQLRQSLQGVGRRVVRRIYPHGDCTSRRKIVSLEPKTKERQCVYPNLRPGNRPRYSK